MLVWLDILNLPALKLLLLYFTAATLYVAVGRVLRFTGAAAC